MTPLIKRLHNFDITGLNRFFVLKTSALKCACERLLTDLVTSAGFATEPFKPLKAIILKTNLFSRKKKQLLNILKPFSNVLQIDFFLC